MPSSTDVVTWATHLIGNWGLPAVFCPHAARERLHPDAQRGDHAVRRLRRERGPPDVSLGIVVAGVAGNLVGSWIAYAVGYYGGRPFVERWGRYVLLRPHHLDTAQRWFDRYGAPVVFFGRMLPIVRTFISLPAGFGRMNFWKFTLYTVLGCVPWVALLGFIGLKLGSNWEKIRPYLHYVDYLVVAVAVALVVWAVLRWRRRRSGAAPDVAGET